LIPIIRTAQVKGKVLKGKDNIPTLILKGFNGEKWELPLNDTLHLENFLINQEIRVRFEDVPHYPLEAEAKVEPADTDDKQAFIEDSASKSSIANCPKGALQDEMGVAEVCVECDHLTRIGGEDLGQGMNACDLNEKPKEEPVKENLTKEAL
jgi:hypothetical protein